MDITQLLAFSVKNKASDLHLSAGLPPMIRVHGDVRRINEAAQVAAVEAHLMASNARLVEVQTAADVANEKRPSSIEASMILPLA